MASDSPVLLLLLIGIAMALAGGVYLIVSPYISGERRAARRIQVVTEARGKRTAIKVQADSGNRRKNVAETLKELEEQQKSVRKITLRGMLQQAGLEMDPRSFYMTSAMFGGIVALFLWLTVSDGFVLPLLGGFVGGLGLPRWVLKKLVKRRQNKFLDEFANSIDIIVRGVKSGLPLTECLAIIGREAPEPVGSEFRELVEQQRVGVTLSEGLERMTQRVQLPEVRFFSIVIGISQQAGGNLSEALANLSGVLRDRKKLQGKVAAMSAEAKASAAVLGCLPFAVMILVYISTPAYISILWTTMFGQFLMVCAAVWMSCGIFVMRKMINFKY